MFTVKVLRCFDTSDYTSVSTLEICSTEITISPNLSATNTKSRKSHRVPRIFILNGISVWPANRHTFASGSIILCETRNCLIILKCSDTHFFRSTAYKFTRIRLCNMRRSSCAYYTQTISSAYLIGQKPRL